MTYPLTFFTNRFLPTFAGGAAYGPVIILRPKYRGTDEGIYKHEVQHVKHWYVVSILSCIAIFPFLPLFWPIGLAVYSLLYKLIPVFRLWAEVDCYKKQAKYYSDDRIPLFAAAIATRYNLKISKENAEKLLREG